jgi:hypothetical protein
MLTFFTNSSHYSSTFETMEALMHVGYIRVSPQDQDFTMQRERLAFGNRV